MLRPLTHVHPSLSPHRPTTRLNLKDTTIRNLSTYVSISLAVASIVFTIARISIPTLPFLLLLVVYMISEFEDGGVLSAPKKPGHVKD